MQSKGSYDSNRRRQLYKSSSSSRSRSRSRTPSHQGRSLHRLPVSHTLRAKELTLSPNTRYNASSTLHAYKDYTNSRSSYVQQVLFSANVKSNTDGDFSGR